MLHLDPFSGIAGNMFLGALLDAGLSRRELAEDLAGLGVPHRLVVSTVRRGPLAARYVRVDVPGAGRHHHAPARPARSDAARAQLAGDPPRALDGAKLRPAVRDRALAIFASLAEAEGARARHRRPSASTSTRWAPSTRSSTWSERQPRSTASA